MIVYTPLKIAELVSPESVPMAWRVVVLEIDMAVE